MLNTAFLNLMESINMHTIMLLILALLALLAIGLLVFRMRQRKLSGITEIPTKTSTKVLNGDEQGVSPVTPYLKSTAHSPAPFIFTLSLEDVTIGRGADNDLVITESFVDWETVSQRHARIYKYGAQWRLEDLDSTNGCYINGRRTRHNLLQNDWQINIGGVGFTFHADDDTASGTYETNTEVSATPSTTPITGEGTGLRAGNTAPLPDLTTAFAPLPEGALLQQSHYAIREVRDSDAQMNTYLVEDLIPARQCPGCNTIISDVKEPFCITCGVDLSSVQPVYVRYVVEETPNTQTTLESWLIGRALQHPGLLLPRAVFTESPYGPERHYRVVPEFPLPLATDIAVPQELNTVLAWGIELAQALEHLHRYQIAFREVGLSHVAIDPQKALWTNLNQAYLIPPESRGTREQLFAYNVQGLARVLLYLATGQNTLTENTELPDTPKALLAQALNTPAGLTATAFGAHLETILQELRRPNSVLLAVGYRTDVGQIRSLNEDSLLTLNFTPIFRSISQPVGVFVVADGMGGHEAGDVASQLVVRTVAQQAMRSIYEPLMADQPLPDIKEWLTNVTAATNQIVYEQRKVAQTDMGTTLVMTLIVGDVATLANVGDSRCYHLSMSGITQITTDHSLVERMIATGQITREEAAQHPQKNVIYRVMGDKPKLAVDVFEKRLSEGEAVLLCSDGLSGMISDRHIWDTWRTSTSPQEACDRLVNAANQAGGEDNITVIIVQTLQ